MVRIRISPVWFMQDEMLPRDRLRFARFIATPFVDQDVVSLLRCTSSFNDGRGIANESHMIWRSISTHIFGFGMVVGS